MTQAKKRIAIYYLALLFFFLLDVTTFAFFEKPMVYSQLGFFVLYTLPYFSLFPLILNIVLILLINFFYQGRLLLAFIYLLPIIFFSIKSQRHLDNHLLIHYALACLSLAFFCIIQAFYFHNNLQCFSYTFLPIPVTLVVMLIFSLIYK